MNAAAAQRRAKPIANLLEILSLLAHVIELALQAVKLRHVCKVTCLGHLIEDRHLLGVTRPFEPCELMLDCVLLNLQLGAGRAKQSCFALAHLEHGLELKELVALGLQGASLRFQVGATGFEL